ncbi:uncharacterized protein LOC123471395 [Daphnia magna]|uniref:uncharacterized protein LOC123471395 n=1 Tax=Daphnia magna TaxID=35525 RepID=UPI001E1BB397|nr:uncharacterized protein LOC123471395 [Daphnia magna]
MQRQIFGSVSSPFLCSQVLRHIADLHHEEFSEAAERVYKNFYVDNLLDSFYTEEEASRAVKDSTALLKKGGFHLNQWPEDLPTERTLGVLYDSESDSFIFDVKTDVKASTKRRILRAVSTLYDPLGFLSPVILSAKRILQEFWLVGVDLDEQVPNQLEAFKIPRALTSSSDIQDIQLHAFCDAFTVGFGSLSRVAPLRPLTVPKLELQGAVVALRLVKFVQSTLRIPINQIIYLSDSKTVVQWIASKTCRFQTFVANRISEILEHSQPTESRHVTGIENLADECSRGLFPDEMMGNYRWVNGKDIWQQEENAWPITIKLPEPSVEDPEVSATNWIGLVYGLAEENRLISLLERNSNYDVVMRIVAWILRFISNSKLKLLDHVKSRIGVKCIQHAANHCIKSAQLEKYSKKNRGFKE